MSILPMHTLHSSEAFQNHLGKNFVAIDKKLYVKPMHNVHTNTETIN